LQRFFATKAKLDISWVGTAETTLLSVKDLHSLSELVAPYLQQLLTEEEAVQEDLSVMDVTMDVTDHTIAFEQDGNQMLTLQTEVKAWYLHHLPLENFAGSLDEALVRNNGLASVLRDVALMQPDATNFLVSVSTMNQDTEVLYSLPDVASEGVQTAAGKGLIAACVLLVLALIFVSSVLVWMAGGCPVLLKKAEHCWTLELYYRNQNREYNDKDDDDAATTASGILGARPSYDETDRGRSSYGSSNDENQMPAGFTPNRGVFREQDCDDSQILTPISTNTDFSTTTSRIVPLGIAPAHHLSTNMLTQRHQTPEKGLYSPNHKLTYT
jgi:hypothetical protein